MNKTKRLMQHLVEESELYLKFPYLKLNDQHEMALNIIHALFLDCEAWQNGNLELQKLLSVHVPSKCPICNQSLLWLDTINRKYYMLACQKHGEWLYDSIEKHWEQKE